MKKLAFAFSALILILTSCSSSSDDPTPTPVDPSSVLLKKMIVTELGQTTTTNITYNGNKIVSSTSTDGTSTVFTYAGNLISKIEYFTDTTLDQRDTYTYNSNNKLITFVSLSYYTPTTGTGVRETFVYNSDGTTSYSHYTGDIASQTTLNHTGKAYYTNGEITKVEEYTGASTAVVNYTYDDKNNIFVNVLGYAATAFTYNTPDGILHNVLSGTNTTSPISNVTYSYTYNSNNFPVTSSETDSFGSVNTQYFYE